MEAVAKTAAHRSATSPAAEPKFAHRQGVESRATVGVQASLKVSSAHDPAEREANDTARKVMRMPAPDAAGVHEGKGGHDVHRKEHVADEHPTVRAEGGREVSCRRGTGESGDVSEFKERQRQAHGGQEIFRKAGDTHGGPGDHDTHREGGDTDDRKSHGRMESPYVARFRNTGILAQAAAMRRGDPPSVDPKIEAEIHSGLTGGSPLPKGVRKFMEPRFRADFSKVRIHTDDRAAKLSLHLRAHAFAYGSHIFFARGQYRPDSHEGRELIAHELTHTIQQRAAVQKKEEAKVRQTAPSQVQRLGMSDALDYIADKANMIPGFRMFTLILGVNPINMDPVERSAANVLRAMVEFIPGGGLITQALDNYGIFDKIGAWVSAQLGTLGMTGSSIKAAVTQFVGSLGLSDLIHPGDVWDRAKKIFTDPIDRIIDFAKGLAAGILKFVKDAILAPIAKLAQGTKGYDLLCAVLGKDPITGVAVPQTAEVLIGGFMKFIGEEEVWANMQKANAIPRAFAWFKGALAELLGFVQEVPTLFINALKALEIADLVLLPRAFIKVAGVFGNFAVRFVTWAGRAVWELLEIIFDVISPGALQYIKKTGSALKSILKNPIPFVGNLVKAAKLGFQNFAGNFGTHLKTALIDWLTGALPGVYIPKAFELGEVVKFVFSVLGITWQKVREKLVKVVGEPAVKAMETGFDIVMTLVTKGPAAAWDKIVGMLADLKEKVIGGITSFVTDMVVQKAVPKLISMFIPGAGFISAILSIYDTVMVFVQKISKIIQVVTGFLDSIVAIAGGAIGAAAGKVESVLAGLMSLAINFFASFIGLGNVAEKVMGVIHKIQGTVDKVLDALVAWIVKMATMLFNKAKSAAAALFDWAATKSGFKDDDGHEHTVFVEDGENPELMIASTKMPAAAFLDFYLDSKKKYPSFASDNAKKIAAVRSAIKVASDAVAATAAAKKAGSSETVLTNRKRAVLEANVGVSGALSALVGSDASVASAREKYLLEGLTGTYSSMPKPKGDKFTADHQPQAAILQEAAKFKFFSKTGELSQRAEGRAKEGFAINLHVIRHMAGETYGGKGGTTKEAFLNRVRPKVKDKEPAKQRSLVVKEIADDLKRDTEAMKTVVAPGSAFWGDIDKEVSCSPAEKEKLKKELSARIINGEEQMAAQDINSLVN